MLKNWQTTLSGAGSLLAGLGGLMYGFSHGTLDGPAITLNLGLISAGITGLRAKDLGNIPTQSQVAQATADSNRKG